MQIGITTKAKVGRKKEHASSYKIFYRNAIILLVSRNEVITKGMNKKKQLLGGIKIGLYPLK